MLDHVQRDVVLKHARRLLQARLFPKTICPSEVARALSAEELQALDASHWRDVMDDVRTVVWEMREAGEVEVLQKGAVTVASPDTIRGPIRVRCARN